MEASLHYDYLTTKYLSESTTDYAASKLINYIKNCSRQSTAINGSEDAGFVATIGI
jgi:hypothetical protein